MVGMAHPSDHSGNTHNLGARDGPAPDVAVETAFRHDQKTADFDKRESHYSEKTTKHNKIYETPL